MTPGICDLLYVLGLFGAFICAIGILKIVDLIFDWLKHRKGK